MHDRPGGAGPDEIVELHDAQVDRLLAYLCAADGTLTHVDAENVVHEAFMAVRANWSTTDQYGGPAIALFVTAQRLASGLAPGSRAPGPNALTESIAPWPDHPDVVRLQVLQDALDKLPVQQRRVVLLRELCRFSVPESGTILELTDNTVESSRGDALRSLMGLLDQGLAARTARVGPLSPDDFVALARVLRRAERRRTITRQRLLDALAGPGRPAEQNVNAETRVWEAPAIGAPPAAPQAAAPMRGMPSGPVPQAPQMSAPQMSAPQMSAPQMSAPQMSAPQMSAPQMSAPQPTYPQPTYPQPTYGGPTYPPGNYTQPPGPLPSAPMTSMLPPGAPMYPLSPIASAMGPGPAANDPLFGPAPVLDFSSSSVSTPIFDSISAWFATGARRPDPVTGGIPDPWAAMEDQGWQAAQQRAAAPPEVAGATGAGLPKRRPGANMVPSAADAAMGMGAVGMFGEPPRMDADGVRRRLDGLQQGVATARRMRHRGDQDPMGPVSGGIPRPGDLLRNGVDVPTGEVFLRADGPRNGSDFSRNGSDQQRNGSNYQRNGSDQQRNGSDYQRNGSDQQRNGPDYQRNGSDQQRNGSDYQRNGGQYPRAGLPSRQPEPPAPPSAPAGRSRPATRSEARSEGRSGARPDGGFDAFYRDYLPQLLAALMMEGASPSVAADVAQSAMNDAYQSWSQLDVPQEWTRGRASGELARRKAQGML